MSDQVPPTWCFKCGGLWLTDFISNVALFAPLGISLVILRVKALRIVVISAFASLAIEYCQSVGLPPGRSAAIADILANACGGALGAALALGWQHYITPSPRFSAFLAVAWGTLSAAVIIGTSFALSTRPRAASTPLEFFASTFTHVPGLGWYEDVVDSVDVESTRIRRGWPGPVILSASRNTDSISATAFVQGRDETDSFVPIIFVHEGVDTSAIVMLGVHGTAAELRTTRRAWDLGLYFPILKLEDALTGQVFRGGKPLMLKANILPDALHLNVATDAKRDSIALSLTPLLGWALIQSVVKVNRPGEFIAACLWVFALMAPVGWWSARSGSRQVRVVVLCAIIMAAGIVSGPMFFHIAKASPFELLVVVSSALIGYILSAKTLQQKSMR